MFLRRVPRDSALLRKTLAKSTRITTEGGVKSPVVRLELVSEETGKLCECKKYGEKIR